VSEEKARAVGAGERSSCASRGHPITDGDGTGPRPRPNDIRYTPRVVEFQGWPSRPHGIGSSSSKLALGSLKDNGEKSRSLTGASRRERDAVP